VLVKITFSATSSPENKPTNNGLHVQNGPTTTPQVTNGPTVDTATSAPIKNSTTASNSSSQGRDMSRVQCFHCQNFGHYARNCPSREEDDPLTAMTMNGKGYYQPKWYEVGLDTLSQVNVLNTRFLQDFIPGDLSFKGLGKQSRSTPYTGTLPLIPELVCQVCDDCAASVLSFSQIHRTGVKITFDSSRDSFIVHTIHGDIEFAQKGDLYLADFREYLTNRAISAMTTKEREELFEKTVVKKAQQAGTFIKNAWYFSEQAAINLIRSGNINNAPIKVQDIKNYFEIYGIPIAAIRGRTTQDKHITKRDIFDEGLKEQITIQEMIADIMHVAGVKFMVAHCSPLQIVLVVPTLSMSMLALGKAMQNIIDIIRMFGFNTRIVYVDPFKSLFGLRGIIPGVEVQSTGAGDHLPKLDIRIRRIKEMARAVLNGLDYKLPLSFVNQLVTFCVCRINVMTTSSLTGNWCPRVHMTGRKVDFKREYALTFGEYV